MVKLSRKGKSRRVRPRKSLKNRSSRRQMMKGGKYYGLDPIYRRKEFGSILYELSLKKDGDNIVYTLDFSKASGALVNVGMKLFKRNEDIAKKYSDTFIGAFGITGEHEQKIRGIIGKLFTEGVAGAKQKKLIITDKSNSIDIELINLGGVSLTKELNVPTTQTFDKYLRGLDDDALVA